MVQYCALLSHDRVVVLRGVLADWPASQAGWLADWPTVNFALRQRLLPNVTNFGRLMTDISRQPSAMPIKQ